VQSIGIRELRERASEILRQVRTDGTSFEVTYHGRVIARLVPSTEPDPDASTDAFWQHWDLLTREISVHWPADVTAVEAVREERWEH
jgi:prevent-host-death family protein